MSLSTIQGPKLQLRALCHHQGKCRLQDICLPEGEEAVDTATSQNLHNSNHLSQDTQAWTHTVCLHQVVNLCIPTWVCPSLLTLEALPQALAQASVFLSSNLTFQPRAVWDLMILKPDSTPSKGSDCYFPMLIKLFTAFPLPPSISSSNESIPS